MDEDQTSCEPLKVVNIPRTAPEGPSELLKFLPTLAELAEGGSIDNCIIMYFDKTEGLCQMTVSDINDTGVLCIYSKVLDAYLQDLLFGED